MHMSAFADEVKSLLVGADDAATARFVDGAEARVSVYMIMLIIGHPWIW
jgi:hypothetical protein